MVVGFDKDQEITEDMKAEILKKIIAEDDELDFE